MRVLSTFLFLLFSIGIAPTSFGATVDNVTCTNFYKKVLVAKVKDLDRAKQPVLRFPKNLDGVPGKQIMYGFESEYTMDQIDGIVKFYGPDPSLGVSKSQWLAMPVADRAKWVRDHLKDLFPTEREAGKLVLLTEKKGYEFLPRALIKDSTGNIEFITGPFDSLEEWYRVATNINKAFGEGSMQAVISTPREAFFDLSSAAATKASVKENEGYLSFFADYDTVEKLTVGHARWEKDSTKKVARSFEHPFLGPLTKQKQDMMEAHLAGNADGQLFDEATRAGIAGSDSSYKYIGGTTYRPDIAGIKRPALEVRDAHNNFQMLYNKVLRNTYYLQEGRAPFQAAKDLQAFDAVKSFEKFDPEVQTMLKELFPNKAKPGVDYSADEIEALNVYRNFSWPLRDWSGHIDFLEYPKLSATIDSAKTKYVVDLRTIQRDLQAGTINKDQAAVKVQGALVEFADSSKLREAYKKKELDLAKNYTKKPEQFLEEIASNNPDFPTSIKVGPVTARIDEFQKKYPNNVKVIDDIKFDMDGVKSSRKVLVISTNGLSDAKKNALRDEYLKYISSNTISFPLGTSAGHLYTRWGGKTLDYFGWWNKNAYSVPGSERLETLIELSPEEFINARTYIDNVNTNRTGVLGSSSYAGAKGDTVRKLDDNKAVVSGEGHNCTSWICTAPIGKDSQTLYELTGATRTQEIHTNPGWWSNWLAAGAKSDKVPAVVYWSDKPLATIESEKIKNGDFLWGFDRH